MSLLQHGAAIPSSAGLYEINNSVKLEPDNAEFLKRNQADGNKRTWTYSMWVKRTELGMSAGMALFYAGVYNQATRIFFDAGSEMDQLTIDLASDSATQYRWITKGVYRDTSAWYHFVWRVDTTQGTATDRMRMYVNGVLLTADDFQQTATFPQNTDTTANDANLGGQQLMAIGNYSWANNNGIYAGYAAQCALVDGQSLAPTDFGKFDEDTGNWIPKDISGLNYGTSNNSFFLDFEDSSDLGANSKGNGANFTLNNIAAVDQATDTPTNNFCTINPLVTQGYAIWSLTEGGTRGANVGANAAMVGTFGVSSGKWYWEGVTTSFSGTNYWQWGVMPIDAKQGNSADSMGDAGTAWYSGDNAFYTSTSQSGQSVAYNIGFSGYTAGDIWSVSLNCDVSPYQMTFRINNAVPGTTANNTDRSVGTYTSARPVFPYIRLANNASDNTWHNFGNPFIATLSGGNTDANGYGDFKYAPPSGYYALCTKNLAEYGG